MAAPLKLKSWAARVAAAGSAAIVLAPFGYRVGAPLGLAFLLLAGGFLAAAVGGLLLVLRMVRKTGLRDREAAAALAAAVVTGAFPLAALLSGGGAPPIHDITTDTDDPPAFVAAVSLNAPGRTDYDPAVAGQQRAAYPDLAPAMLPVPPSDAFDRALAVVGDTDWELLATDAGALRIEATDRSFWFGFPDDVVVRVAPDGDTGSRVDVRSLSRVGVGDLGVNARRVREFVAALAEPQ